MAKSKCKNKNLGDLANIQIFVGFSVFISAPIAGRVVLKLVVLLRLQTRCLSFITLISTALKRRVLAFKLLSGNDL